MKWRSISEEMPKWGEWIWVWDRRKQKKILIRYFGSSEKLKKENDLNFPFWAKLNDIEADSSIFSEEWGGIARMRTSDGRNVNIAEKINRVKKEIVNGI